MTIRVWSKYSYGPEYIYASGCIICVPWTHPPFVFYRLSDEVRFLTVSVEYLIMRGATAGKTQSFADPFPNFFPDHSSLIDFKYNCEENCYCV